jgi:glutaminyl-tRNA synthetase
LVIIFIRYIHWIADCPSKNSPIRATVRVFHPLFNSDNPDSHPDGYLSVVNSNSEDIYTGAMIETGFEEIRVRAPWPSADGEKKEKDSGSEVRPELCGFRV